MGRDGTTVHRWTDDDELALGGAVERMEPMRSHYDRQGYPEGRWWDSVAGSLYVATDGRVSVTGKSCRERWRQIGLRREEAQRAALEPLDDVWADVAARVEEHERSLAEATHDELQALRGEVARLARAVEAIAGELGVEL